jgi:tetratricopeptide (TPR) repeat protein
MGTIFINYRREDSISTSGRLYDRLSQTFGRKNIFMDVDHIPAGVDFVAHLNSQVAACNIILVVIGPHWLEAKDENGARRLDNPDDFVVIEIATALARNIRVIPVLVDGARMPKAGELPGSLKALARRQAVEVRQLHFGRDAEALLERINEALGGEFSWQRPWRLKAAVGAVAAVLLLLAGWIGFSSIDFSGSTPSAEMRQEVTTEQERQVKTAAVPQAKRNAEEGEQQRIAAAKADNDKKAKAAAAEAERQRIADAKAEDEKKAKAAAEAEQQRLASLKAEDDRKRGEDETRTRYTTLVSQSNTDINAGNYDKAIATLSEAMRLNPNDQGLASFKRGIAYGSKGDYERAIADFSETVRLDPKSVLAFRNRGLAYEKKGDYDRAIVDFSEAIRLDPKYALAFYSRGLTFGTKGDNNRAIADFNEAIRLNPNYAPAFGNRGLAYDRKGNPDRAIADFNEAIRLDPKYAFAFLSRGVAYGNKGDNDRAIADFSEAVRLNPTYALAFGNRGLVYERKGSYDRAIADFNEAIRLDPNYAIAFRGRGIVYGNKGDYDRAITDFTEAIRLDPKLGSAFSNRGLAYEKKGGFDRAIADFNEAIRLNPNDAISFCRRGRAKSKINEQGGDADIARAKQLDATVCR